MSSVLESSLVFCLAPREQLVPCPGRQPCKHVSSFFPWWQAHLIILKRKPSPEEATLSALCVARAAVTSIASGRPEHHGESQPRGGARWALPAPCLPHTPGSANQLPLGWVNRWMELGRGSFAAFSNHHSCATRGASPEAFAFYPCSACLSSLTFKYNESSSTPGSSEPQRIHAGLAGKSALLSKVIYF